MNNPSPASLWQATLSELELQMTKATFNTWLKDTVPVNLNDSTLTVLCKSAYAQEWLFSRLAATVNRTLQSISGNDKLTAFFVVAPDALPLDLPESPAPEAPDLTCAPVSELPRFEGFDPPRSHFLPLPWQVVREIMPYVKPTVFVFTVAVIAHTMGVIENYRTRAMREWWEVSNREVMQICNISRNSFFDARRTAIANGYVVSEAGILHPRYRPRLIGEPVDN